MEIVVRIFGNRSRPDDDSKEEGDGSPDAVPSNVVADHEKHGKLSHDDREMDPCEV